MVTQTVSATMCHTVLFLDYAVINPFTLRVILKLVVLSCGTYDNKLKTKLLEIFREE